MRVAQPFPTSRGVVRRRAARPRRHRGRHAVALLASASIASIASTAAAQSPPASPAVSPAPTPPPAAATGATTSVFPPLAASEVPYAGLPYPPAFAPRWEAAATLPRLATPLESPVSRRLLPVDPRKQNMPRLPKSLLITGTALSGAGILGSFVFALTTADQGGDLGASFIPFAGPWILGADRQRSHHEDTVAIAYGIGAAQALGVMTIFAGCIVRSQMNIAATGSAPRADVALTVVPIIGSERGGLAVSGSF